MEVVDTQRRSPLVPLVPVPSAVLLEAPVAFEVVSVAASMAEEAEVVSVEVFKTGEAIMVEEEEVLVTREEEASHPEVGLAEETVVGILGLTDMELHPQMPQLVQAALGVVTKVAEDMAEEAMEALAHLIAVDLASLHQLVGMIRVAAVAHMMTDPADIVVAAVEAMETVMRRLEEVAATWSR